MSSGRKRTRLSPEERRRQLVDVAVELLLSRPLDDVTVDEVASGAGVSRALIFHYFPTLRDLHLAAVDAAASILVEQLTEAIGSAQPGERLPAGIDAFVSFIERQPRTFDALSLMAASDPDIGSVFQEVRRQAALLVSESFEDETSDLNDLLIAGWVAFVEHVARSWVTEPSSIQREELLEALLDGAFALLKGVSRPPA